METNVTNSASENIQSENAGMIVREKNPHKYLMLGLWLIGLGTVWLLWNAHLIRWAEVERFGFIIFGLFLLVRTVVLKKYNLFWGGTFLLVGCFHLYLDNVGDFRMRELWPMYLLIAGGMSLANFIVNLKRWFSLVAGLFLLVFGGVYMSQTFFMMPYELIMWTKLYWPLTFVVAGVILVAIAFIKGRRTT
ncbi:hypothetical protein JNL27_08565 [bacterium]|nr:hypothetical protein [bacterium]